MFAKELIYIFEILTDMNVLYDSFTKCTDNVDWKCSVQKYEYNILQNLKKLRESLLNGTYKPNKYTEFYVSERGKKRKIDAPSFNDKVLYRAVCDYILEPVLSRYMIYKNGASIKGKGVGFSRENLDKDLMSYYRENGNVGYILISDYRKFFESIPHDKLIESLKKCIRDEKVINLLKDIIYSFNDDGVGLAIGCSPSQLFGSFYPTPVDNYCTNVEGCERYARHMDDFYVIHEDKGFLKTLLLSIEEISGKLGLSLNKKKTQICRIDKGFVFLKQYIFITDSGKIVHKPYKKNITRERRKLKSFKNKLDLGSMDIVDIEKCYGSWRGSIEKFDTHHIIYNMDNLYNNLFNN